MNTPFSPFILPLLALVITGATAFFAVDHLPYKIPLAAYRYTGAIVVIYAFFRLIAFADKRRTAQLDDVGLFRPLHDGAFLLCTHAHLIALGQNLGWLPSGADLRIGALSWAILLIGHYAPRQPDGLPARLIDVLPGAPLSRTQLCKGLMLSGALGVAGTFVAYVQPAWILAPVGITLILSHRIAGKATP